MNQDLTPFEERLIEGCLREESRSQEGLYRHYYGYVMAIALRYTHSADEAKEILNDAFFKVFSKLDQYDDRKSFKGWLRRIVINTAIDYYRSNQKHVYHHDIAVAERQEDDYDVIDEMSAEDILGLLSALPVAYRLTFNLYEIEGFSHEEISKRLGVPVGTSRSNLSRAKRKLRELVGRLFEERHEKAIR